MTLSAPREVSLCPQCNASSHPHAEHCAYCGTFFAEKPLIAFSFKTLSLSGQIINKITRALAELDEFDSNRALRTFVTRKPLDVFKNQVPEADSSLDRAQFFVAFAIGKAYAGNGEWWGGMNLLVVFLTELYTKYRFAGQANPLTELFIELDALGLITVK